MMSESPIGRQTDVCRSSACFVIVSASGRPAFIAHKLIVVSIAPLLPCPNIRSCPFAAPRESGSKLTLRLSARTLETHGGEDCRLNDGSVMLVESIQIVSHDGVASVSDPVTGRQYAVEKLIDVSTIYRMGISTERAVTVTTVS